MRIIKKKMDKRKMIKRVKYQIILSSIATYLMNSNESAKVGDIITLKNK